jgi:hypothetical protein
VIEAHRVATIAARERGDTCPTATEICAVLRRWAYVTSIEQTRRDCYDLRLTIADSHVEPK